MQRKKRFFTGTATIMALLMAVLVLFSGCDSSSGSSRRSRDDDDDDRSSSYETVINKFISAMQNEDGSTAAGLFSEAAMEGEDVSEGELAEYLEETFEGMIEELEDMVGRNVKIKVSDIDGYVYDEDDFDGWIDDNDDYGYDVSSIRSVAEVEAYIEVTGGDDEFEFEMEFEMVQEGKNWKIWDFNIY